MIEVSPGLFVGNEFDYESQVKEKEGWRVVQACQSPYHRQALGYRGRGAPKDHPEYLIAPRESRLILNLVDAPDPKYFSTEIFDAAIDFIEKSLKAGNKVLVHCNKGFSRGPGLALLYLASRANVLPSASYQEAETAFSQVYPGYSPSSGVRGFLQINWSRYCQ